ncbi:MAG: chromosome segregation protein SMC [Verrucomicrobiota bacterium]
MLLKSLDLHGFKSFAEKTRFEFHDGVTGIVGPNGCGKSNVVDAIRWVLGETSAKALRGGEMADVIFNGTESRKAHGMAEVVLTLGDCEDALGTDFNEVAIARRVYRDGKGEYLLNGKLCRLKDIHNLFMDTGIGRTAYSIMEQGKIDMLLSSKPEDRRAVFEEAAGITKFKSQKKEALRKLEYTEANLIRVVDIIEEVKRQMNTLNRQAQKAKRFEALFDDVKVLDTHFSHRQHAEFVGERSEFETSVNALVQEHEELEERIADSEREVSALREALSSIEALLSSKREELIRVQNQRHSAENRIEFNEERRVELEGLIAQHETDITGNKGRLTERESELSSTNDLLAASETSLARLREQLASLQEQYLQRKAEKNSLEESLQSFQEALRDRENAIVQAEAQLEGHNERISSTEGRKLRLAEDVARLENEQASKDGERSTLAADFEAKGRALDEARRSLAVVEDEFRGAEGRLSSLSEEVSVLHRRLAEKQSRLEVVKQLVETGEGLESGTQAVMQGLDNPEFFRNGVRGLLSGFLDVEPGSIAAIEAAIGVELQTIVVTGPEIAESIVNTLRHGELGSARVVPEVWSTPAPSSQIEALPEGAIAWAIDRVTPHERVRGLVSRLLEQVLIAPDLETALRLRTEVPSGVAIAGQDGSFISREGIIHGGAGDKETSSMLHRQQEIRELESDVSELEDEHRSKEESLNRLRSEVESLRGRREEQREAVQQAQVAVSTFQGQVSLVERELDQLSVRLGSARDEQASAETVTDELTHQLEGLRQAKAEAGATLESVRGEIQAAESGLAEAVRREAEASELLNEQRTSIAVEARSYQSLQEQKEPLAARLEELHEAIERRREEIESHRQRIAASAQENESLTNEIAGLSEKTNALEGAIESLGREREVEAGKVGEAESAVSQLRRDLTQNTEQKGQEEVKITQISLRLENLVEAVAQRYQVNLDGFEPDAHRLLAAIESQKKASSRRQKRRATMEAKAGAQTEPMEFEDSAEAENGSGVELEADLENEVEETSIPSEESGPDWDFVGENLPELRQRLDGMGPVNLDAIQEFTELEERYQFLEKEHADLTNSKEELHRIIAKINRETKEMFATTFEQVRTNFRQTFRQLFGDKGRADLVLVDDEDPLESGIDVIAKPPGKKLQSITLLSGGERSMTAVALLFSIYMVKPSPFCVLDELDAPLDDANIGRFLGMLEGFIRDSQFVIVTHNRRTMHRCDVLYGVTMEEFGVSKRIGMKFHDADEVVGNEDNARAESLEKTKGA